MSDAAPSDGADARAASKEGNRSICREEKGVIAVECAVGFTLTREQGAGVMRLEYQSKPISAAEVASALRHRDNHPRASSSLPKVVANAQRRRRTRCAHVGAAPKSTCTWRPRPKVRSCGGAAFTLPSEHSPSSLGGHDEERWCGLRGVRSSPPPSTPIMYEMRNGLSPKA
eukprot:6209817-Pleurochrysis_carterae.AAC.1